MEEIPKHIYICHKSKDMVDTYSAPKWKELNPDYEIHTYGNDDCIAFLQNEYGQLYVDTFNYIRAGPIKGDFWRVCILYKYGGVYADADIDPIVPISKFLEKGVQFLTSTSYQPNLLNPHVIMSMPGHSILKECMDTYVEYYTQKKPFNYWGWSITNIMLAPLKKHIPSLREGVYSTSYQLISEMWPRNGNLSDVFCSYKGVKLLLNRSVHYNPNTHDFKNAPVPIPVKGPHRFNMRKLRW